MTRNETTSGSSRLPDLPVVTSFVMVTSAGASFEPQACFDSRRIELTPLELNHRSIGFGVWHSRGQRLTDDSVSRRLSTPTIATSESLTERTSNCDVTNPRDHWSTMTPRRK